MTRKSLKPCINVKNVSQFGSYKIKISFLKIFLLIVASCGDELTEKSGTVTSPEWPSPYPSHQNCSWKITCDADVEIKIKNIEIGPDIAGNS